MRLISKVLFPLTGFGLLAASASFAKTIPVERKYKEDVKYSNEHMAVILETSIYDMFENSNLDPIRTRLMKFAVKEPIVDIISDFNYVNASILPQDAQVAKKWGLKDTSSGSWLEWFGARVKIISSGDSRAEAFWNDRFEADKSQPINGETLASASANRTVGATPIASNLTNKLLARSLKSGYALRYRNSLFPSLVGGAHFGLINIQHGHFSTKIRAVDDKASKRFSLPSYALKVYRMSTLLHEARHSDSSEPETMFFIHSICPNGHPSEGKRDCDRSQNGPYSVSADFIRLYVNACKIKQLNQVCTEAEIDYMEGLILEDMSHVLDSEIYPVDGEGQKVVNSIDPTPLVFKGIAQQDIRRK